MIILTDQQKNLIKEIVEWIVCIIVAVVIAMVIRYFIGTPTVVQQTSMFPTLQEEQRLWLNRLPRTFKQDLKQGDIITFDAPSDRFIAKEDVDINNPVARYDEDPKGLWSKFTYYVLEYKNYEMKPAKEKVSYIKRVIATAGQHVKIADGKVYVDNEPLKEDYLKEGVYTTELEGQFVDLTVPDGCIYVLGDNRAGSTDSRRFGCIPLEKVEGKVLFRFWPLEVFGKVR